MATFTTTPIEGLIIIEPRVFSDERGFFMETYSEKEYRNGWITAHFVQDNHSKSAKWVLRGLHFQTEHTQAKLVRVTAWSVYDVAVDLRKSSPTYGKWYGIVLSAQNKLQFYIPAWFAHGFLTLEDNTEFLYKCSEFYDKESEWWILYNDSDLAIDWSTYLSSESFTISEKDRYHSTFAHFHTINPF
jgi:dTDP-4-dehydrorhamnose 3,5-epimerase